MSINDPKKSGAELNRRRSQRVIVTIAVNVRTEADRGGDSFEEATRTLLVNAHGALIVLGHKVTKGQKLLITNCATHVEHTCRVAHVSPSSDDKAQVGIEFTSPSPDFWRIAFPPEDWVVPDPEPVVRNTK